MNASSARLAPLSFPSTVSPMLKLHTLLCLLYMPQSFPNMVFPPVYTKDFRPYSIEKLCRLVWIPRGLT